MELIKGYARAQAQYEAQTDDMPCGCDRGFCDCDECYCGDEEEDQPILGEG